MTICPTWGAGHDNIGPYCSQKCYEELRTRSWNIYCNTKVCAKCGGHQSLGILPCRHGLTSNHKYCSHNKTTQHDD